MATACAAPNRSALVIGASGGIGAAIASALREDSAFASVVTLSRTSNGFDITNECSVREGAAQLAEHGSRFDLIFDATGALEANGNPPEKAFAALEPASLQASFSVNAVGPALLFKHFASLLNHKGRSVFATLSARVGSIGDNRLGGWMSYRASKAALNQIVRCAAIEIKRGRPNSIVVALHPGTIETPLTRKYARGRFTHTANAAARKMLNALEALSAKDTGKFFDYAGNIVDW